MNSGSTRKNKILAAARILRNTRRTDIGRRMLEAIKAENVEEVDRLLVMPGVNLSYKDMDEDDDNRINVVTLAKRKKNHNILVRLVKYAIDHNQVDIASSLINISYKYGITLLMYEVGNYNTDMVKKLLAVPGIDVNLTDEEGDTALIIAVSEEYIEGIKLLLAVPGIDVNYENIHGNTALMLAVSEGHIEIAKLLLAVPDINVGYENSDGFNALIAAISGEHIESVKLMLGVPGIDVNHITDDGYNALNIALDSEANIRTSNIIRLLLAIPEIDVNQSNPNYEDLPLTAALARKRAGDIIVSLIDKTVDINFINYELKTALQYALMYPDPAKNNPGLRLRIVKALLAKHADPRLGLEPSPYTNAINNVYTSEINRVIRQSVPISLEFAWKGYSRGDIAMFNGVFESVEKSQNISLCPVCLSYVEHRDACMYMSHNCSQGGNIYDIDLYNKYKSGGTGRIYWCTVCSRICSDTHRHYQLSSASGPKPNFMVNPLGSLYITTDENCKAQGGGGLDEKLKRINGLKEHAKRLQPEIGRISKQDAKDELVEAAWDAALTGMRGTLARIKDTRQFSVPNTNFPNNVPPPPPPANALAVLVYPTIAYPGEGIPEQFPVLHQNVPNASEFGEETPVAVQFRHRMADNTLNRHQDNYIGIDNLFRLFMNNQDFALPAWGMCWMFTDTEHQCTARLYPQEAADILVKAQPLITPEAHAEYTQILNNYARRFNQKFAVAGGGRRKTYRRKRAQRQKGSGLSDTELVASPDAESMIPPVLDAECTLSPLTRQTAKTRRHGRRH